MNRVAVLTIIVPGIFFLFNHHRCLFILLRRLNIRIIHLDLSTFIRCNDVVVNALVEFLDNVVSDQSLNMRRLKEQ